jgi:hypothetical protein
MYKKSPILTTPHESFKNEEGIPSLSALDSISIKRPTTSLSFYGLIWNLLNTASIFVWCSARHCKWLSFHNSTFSPRTAAVAFHLEPTTVEREGHCCQMSLFSSMLLESLWSQLPITAPFVSEVDWSHYQLSNGVIPILLLRRVPSFGARSYLNIKVRIQLLVLQKNSISLLVTLTFR